ncbi:MAG TPA: ABC transporter permease subunit [Bacilli bacterium]
MGAYIAYIWKEWREALRGKGFWLIMGLFALLSVLMLWQARTFPAEQGLKLYLLSLYELEVYLVPLLALFFSAMSVLQEKEQKTMLLLVVKREKPATFLWKKGIAVQFTILPSVLLLKLVLVLPLKILFAFAWSGYLPYVAVLLALWLVFNQMGVAAGAFCGNKMQLAGAAVALWFLFVFAADTVLLYLLPTVTAENMALFSTLYFIDPLHALHFYLETAFGFFPLEHMSRVMKQMVMLSPAAYVALDLAVWLPLLSALAVFAGRRVAQQ